MNQINPILAEVTRGNIVESFHRGAVAVVDAKGQLLVERGDVNLPVFPRSAIKAFQTLPLLESGAADAYQFTPQELSLACASHNGEELHVETVRQMLAKAGLNEDNLECGSHWPMLSKAGRAMAARGEKPLSVHNNCSGKHAGMLATARHLGISIEDYVNVDHPIQVRVKAILADYCECDLHAAPCGTDGCSVPTWAMPLKNLALGFAKFSHSSGPSPALDKSSRRIIDAIRDEPFMVAGTQRFCTDVMLKVPRLFVKTGAEGVYTGCIPHAGIGIAIKCDDGATRAAEVIFAKTAAALNVWERDEVSALESFSKAEIKNRNSNVTGELYACSI